MNLSKEFIDSIVRQVNPLYLQKPDGTSWVFPCYTDCYLKFMMMCKEVAPKGYMDILVILVEMYGWRFTKAFTVYKGTLERSLGERITMITFKDQGSKMYFRKVITALQLYYNTPFDLMAFEAAWKLFKEYVNPHFNPIKDEIEKTRTEGDKE